MEFRVADERSWQHQFEADCPSDITEGIVDAWVEYIKSRSSPAGTEGVNSMLAFRARKIWLDEWLDEKLEDPRLEDRPELEDEWRNQYQRSLAKARREFGLSRNNSPLYLHVKYNGRWYTMGYTEEGYGGCSASNRTRVSRDESDRAQEHWDAAKAAIKHAKQFDQIADFASKNVEFDSERDFEVIE